MKANNSNWNGYNLEQIRIMQATTDLKIEIEKEHIRYAYNRSMGKNQDGERGLGSLLTSADSILRTTLYGVKSYRMVKNFIGICKNLKNKR